MMTILSDILGTSLEVAILYSLQYTKNKKHSKKVISTLFFLLAAFIVLLTKIGMGFVSKMILIFICTLIFSKICFQTTFKKILFNYIVYLISIIIGEIMCFGFFRIIYNHSIQTMMEENPFVLLCIICVAKLITLFFTYYVKHFIHRAQKIIGKDLLLVITPLATSFLLLFIITLRLYLLPKIDTSENLFMGLGALLIILSITCIVVLIEKYLQTKSFERSTHLDITQISNSYTYLTQKIESHEKVMELYHDLKNHLLILNAKQEEPEYIHGLLDKINDYEMFIDTGNAILNTIIYEKSKISKANEIDFEALIDISRISSLKDFDICSIFGNAIDNAIEASLKIKDVSKRKIIVKAGKIRGFLIIKIENYKNNEIFLDDDQIKSSKKNATLHGHGIKSIMRSVHKYNGEINIHYNSSNFSLNIAIPAGL